MIKNRISSLTTIWFAWILPIAMLALWTFVTVVVLISDFPFSLSAYLFVATSVLWLVYLVSKPWKYKRISENEKGIIIELPKGDVQIPYKNVKSIKSLFSMKLSPTTITYMENEKLYTIRFISRLTSPVFSLPMEENPVIQMIKEEVSSVNNEHKNI